MLVCSIVSDGLGKELKSCSSWLIDNKLFLHLGKTKCILFDFKRKFSKNKLFNINCEGNIIVSTSSVKCHGPVLENTVSENCALT